MLLASTLNFRGSLIAGAIIAVNPFLVFFTGLLLSETLFICLLTWATLQLLRRKFLIAAILFAAAAYVRPTALLLAPALCITTAIALRDKQAWRAIPVIVAVLVIALLPWAARNHHVLGRWIFTTTNGGVTLYDGFNPIADGSSNQRFLVEMPQLSLMTETQRDDELKSLAQTWATNHFSELPMLTLKKIARLWSPLPLSADFGRPLYRIIAACYTIPFDVLAILALVLSRANPRTKLLLLTPAIVLTFVHAASVGSLRYRIPAEPLLAVLICSSNLFSADAQHRGVRTRHRKGR
jgi:hypothetical protein